MRTVAVVLAGGTGQRLRSPGTEPAGTGTSPAGAAGPGAGLPGPGPVVLPKQLLALGGVTLLERSVAAFDAAPDVDEVLVVMAAGFTGHAGQVLGNRYPKLTAVVPGGPARADSTRCALAELAGRSECNVLLHDAARPLVSPQIIAGCIEALRQHAAVGVVVPSSDTIVEIAAGTLTRMLPRAALARCQTPQGFRLSVIAAAHARAAADPAFTAAAATDDCGLVLRYLPDVPVAAVPGSDRNIKITYPADLAVAEALLRETSPGR